MVVVVVSRQCEPAPGGNKNPLITTVRCRTCCRIFTQRSSALGWTCAAMSSGVAASSWLCCKGAMQVVGHSWTDPVSSDQTPACLVRDSYYSSGRKHLVFHCIGVPDKHVEHKCFHNWSIKRKGNCLSRKCHHLWWSWDYCKHFVAQSNFGDVRQFLTRMGFCSCLIRIEWQYVSCIIRCWFNLILTRFYLRLTLGALFRYANCKRISKNPQLCISERCAKKLFAVGVAVPCPDGLEYVGGFCGGLRKLILTDWQGLERGRLLVSICFVDVSKLGEQRRCIFNKGNYMNRPIYMIYIHIYIIC